MSQKKDESEDLRSVAFCPPVVQKKKKQRPTKGQKRGRGIGVDQL